MILEGIHASAPVLFIKDRFTLERTILKKFIFHFNGKSGAHKVYFTRDRVLKDALPEKVYAYELRHDMDDDESPVFIEGYVFNNYYGTILTSSPILRRPEDSLTLNSYIDLKDIDFADSIREESSLFRKVVSMTPRGFTELKKISIPKSGPAAISRTHNGNITVICTDGEGSHEMHGLLEMDCEDYRTIIRALRS